MSMAAIGFAAVGAVLFVYGLYLKHKIREARE